MNDSSFKGSALWGRGEFFHCLVSAPSFVSPSLFQEEEIDLSQVPVMYHDLRAVFSVS